ncbi:4-alpha-glucanotransferase [Candidatus Woesearchaeota archaeon]|nr:4-alpha-glucanotransferase [Candidatus Woesearchaeota archaeon]
MLGWEFPPVYSGGLGTACYGLTKGLSKTDVEVTFVMPTGPDNIKGEFVNLIVADKLLKKLNVKKVETILTPYLSSEAYKDEYLRIMKKGNEGILYGRDLFEEVLRYSERVKLISMDEEFDVIHAHDWMTYKAGIKAKNATGKPLVVHIHATEFDRTGGNNLNQQVYDLEREGFHTADKIIAVSNYTKSIVVRHYGIKPDKVVVVHNAVEFNEKVVYNIKKTDKVVLFLGRITLQKGPDYFLEAARKVLKKDSNIKFVFAGSGDMETRMIERAAEMGISKKVLFAGFLKGKDVNKAYQMADVYVMPSVSEPFGITPLEAMRSGTPVIISKQSGVSEVINHVLKVDFWDVNDIASKILAVINYRTLTHELKHHGSLEVLKFDWKIPAKKCAKVYEGVAK